MAMHDDTHGGKGEKWVGFDLDGTLAKYDHWRGIDYIGEPISPMVEKIKQLHADGKEVRILTARVSPARKDVDVDEARRHIEKWCRENLGFVPPITHEKDQYMSAMYDDRAVQVIPNEGVVVAEAARRFGDGKNGPDVRAFVKWLAKGDSD